MFLFICNINGIKNRTHIEKTFISWESAKAFFNNAVMRYFTESKSWLTEFNYKEYLKDLEETVDATYMISEGRSAFFENDGSTIEVKPIKQPLLHKLMAYKNVFCEAVVEGAVAYVGDDLHGYKAHTILGVRKRRSYEKNLFYTEIFNRWVIEKYNDIEKSFSDTTKKENAIKSTPKVFSIHAEAKMGNEILDVFLSEDNKDTKFNPNQYQIID